MHEVRRQGLGIMSRVHADEKTVSFIEDSAIPLERLPEHIARLRAICAEEGLSHGDIIYGHASVGVLHFKPYVNTKSAEDLERMDRVASRAAALAREFGGSWSGEHGDGIIRGAKNPEFWGEEIIALFREVKRLFDPEGRLNPGKIVDTPPMTALQRYHPDYRWRRGETHFHFRTEGGLQGAIEMCNGVGACRKIGDGTMCPSFMATRDEAHSTRGRANALRLAMTGQLGTEEMAEEALREALDLCLQCKACATECPSTVDMAKMKSEFLAALHERHGTTLRERLFAGSPRMARRFAGPLAWVVNPVQSLTVTLLRRALGVAKGRRIPPLATRTLVSWHRRHRSPSPAEGPTVALFADTYSNCYEPEVGRWMIRVLEQLGCRVELANAGCCQRPVISKGFLRRAETEGLKTLRRLDAWARRGIPIVVLEPSCLSSLRDDLPDLIDDVELGQRVASAVTSPEHLVDSLLTQRGISGSSGLRFLLHSHCHQAGHGEGEAALRAITRCGGEIREIPSGCCGMAGSFGYEAEHLDLSLRVGEERLLPAVREAPEDTLIVASGFSCRHQIADATNRRAIHFVEAVGRALLGDSP
jgi:Fe-S oxidoreductase